MTKLDLTSFISIDTETTGLSFENDRVIQFGAAVFIKGKEVHNESFYIQSDVPNNGFNINEITDEQIANGEPEGSAFAMIALLLTKTIGNQYPRILAYNAPFDLGMITAEFRRREISYNLKQAHIIDPLVIWRHFHQFQKGKLENVSSYYGIPNLKAHDAGADAACAGHIYLKMLERYGILHNQYITEMQKRWHNSWADGMKQWAQGKNIEMNIEPWPTREDWMCFNQKSDTLF